MKQQKTSVNVTVSPLLQKLFVAAAAAVWLLPFLIQTYYYAKYGYGGSGFSWQILFYSGLTFVAPVVYFVVAWWLLPMRQAGKLAHAFSAALVAFITYSFVSFVDQLVNAFGSRYLYNGDKTNVALQVTSYVVPQVLGLVVLVGCLVKAKRK